jgi:S1-C subfamily serine protease
LGITAANWDQGGIRGVLFVDVFNNGSAHLAGSHKGDIITQVNGRDITSAQFLVRVLASMEPGTTVKIGYLVKTDLVWMPRETVAILAKME